MRMSARVPRARTTGVSRRGNYITNRRERARVACWRDSTRTARGVNEASCAADASRPQSVYECPDHRVSFTTQARALGLKRSSDEERVPVQLHRPNLAGRVVRHRSQRTPFKVVTVRRVEPIAAVIPLEHPVNAADRP